jgi:hypothetical protein
VMRGAFVAAAETPETATGGLLPPQSRTPFRDSTLMQVHHTCSMCTRAKSGCIRTVNRPGCHLSTSLRYADRIALGSAVRATPSTLYQSSSLIARAPTWRTQVRVNTRKPMHASRILRRVSKSRPAWQ